MYMANVGTLKRTEQLSRAKLNIRMTVRLVALNLFDREIKNISFFFNALSQLSPLVLCNFVLSCSWNTFSTFRNKNCNNETCERPLIIDLK